jgi:hypothetical protein
VRLGTPAVVRLGFDDHGLGNLINHCFNPHTDSRMRTPQKCVVQLRFVWWWSLHHNSQNSSPIPPDAAGNHLPHTAKRYIRLKLYWNWASR